MDKWTKQMMAAAALLATGAVWAGEAAIDMYGEDSGSFALSAQLTAPQPLTRAEVVAEVARARELGELGVLCGEDSGSFWLSAHMDAPAEGRRILAASPANPR